MAPVALPPELDLRVPIELFGNSEDIVSYGPQAEGASTGETGFLGVTSRPGLVEPVTSSDALRVSKSEVAEAAPRDVVNGVLELLRAKGVPEDEAIASQMAAFFMPG